MRRLIYTVLFASFALHSMPVFAASKEKKKNHSDRPFVTSNIFGQLGNQLFEVATACALAWDNNAEPVFPDFHSKSLDYLHVFFRFSRDIGNRKITFNWGEPAEGYCPIPYHPNMKIHGYYQCEKYFAHYRDRLLELFAPHPSDLRYMKKRYKWLFEHPQTVGVQVRYYGEDKDQLGFVQYDLEYFEKAMALFPEDSLFVVSSDNIEFARKNMPKWAKNIVFLKNEHHYIDFYLLSFCKHNIISNSSFGWWAAWLNQNPDKIVVRPDFWIGSIPDVIGPGDAVRIKADSFQKRVYNERVQNGEINPD